ncbi:GNAT family N-acetyltransferase [Nocardiopsis sp. RSe5-2]|uniref:GNAT family N-acetyltransferase n=1 Tax=Nocardiopsis endophytica TaxID=3018445 RepID=A0ABT4UE02_9ACTN|nr:GNAT family N-acetyltransferase [Nocardiopsis endophytica]MDA2815173.1 GNAT family N-acetyltransferase [Nocardiopsis endophytica]
MRAHTPPEPAAAPVLAAASPEDAGAIWTLQRAAYVSEAQIYGDPYLPPLAETEQQVRAAFDRGPVLTAVLGGRIVGAVRGAAAERAFLVGRLAVAPDARRRGIGRALMAELERRAAAGHPALERFAVSVGHGSEAALRLFRSLGYTEASRERIADHRTLVHLGKAVRPGGAPAAAPEGAVP